MSQRKRKRKNNLVQRARSFSEGVVDSRRFLRVKRTPSCFDILTTDVLNYMMINFLSSVEIRKCYCASKKFHVLSRFQLDVLLTGRYMNMLRSVSEGNKDVFKYICRSLRLKEFPEVLSQTAVAWCCALSNGDILFAKLIIEKLPSFDIRNYERHCDDVLEHLACSKELNIDVLYYACEYLRMEKGWTPSEKLFDYIAMYQSAPQAINAMKKIKSIGIGIPQGVAFNDKVPQQTRDWLLLEG